MKLSDYLTIRLSAIFLLILLIWSVIYFFIQMKEIHDGIDEGLNNLKQEFVYKANNSEGFIDAMQTHNPLNIIVEKIPYEKAKDFTETYTDSKVYFVTEEEEEEVRMLTSAFYCETDKQYYKLKFFTSTVERDDLVKNMLYLLIALWLCLAIAIVLVIKIIIHRSSKPFYKLLDDLKKFELEKSTMIEFEKTNISEYAELNKSVEKLLEDNIRAFSEQKNFIENASHEIQTPLAVAIGKLELMMDNSQLNQKQMEEIHSVLNNLNRLKRLNSSLLLLSKIRNKQFQRNEEVNINTVLNESLDNLNDLIKHKEITVNISREESDVIINMNRDLAFILVDNLLKNAVFHNIKSGKINIELGNQTLIISNNGAPMDKDIDIFERYRSISRDKESLGLGLSIVKSITEIYRFSINYLYDKQHIIKLEFRPTDI